LNELANLFAQFNIQSFLNFTQTLIVLIDSDGRLLAWNPAFGQMKEASPNAASIQDLFVASSQPLFSEMMQAKEPRQASLGLSSEPKGLSFKCLLAPVPGGNFLFFAESARETRDEKLAQLTDDLKKTKHALKIKKIDLESVLVQAREISHTDSLTFLPNRRQIISNLQRQVALSDRYRTPLTIFMLDIDHFKRVNDSFGHAAGDSVLQTLAGHLLESIREVDEVGRFGGEEFLILLPGTTEKSAGKLADRLLGLVRGLEINTDDKVVKITISIGIAEYRISEESWDEFFKRADRALYQSKENGRDQWTISKLSQN
jgi:diguanylate cyclase (GGDEF)-like protein